MENTNDANASVFGSNMRGLDMQANRFDKAARKVMEKGNLPNVDQNDLHGQLKISGV